jgi:hypothetical protein
MEKLEILKNLYEKVCAENKKLKEKEKVKETTL